MKNRIFRAGAIIAAVVAMGCATTDEQVIVSFAPLSVATGNAQTVDDLAPLTERHRAATKRRSGN